MEAGISLGANEGDRLAQMRRAVDALGVCFGVRLLERSPVYETLPIGVPERYCGLRFLNAVLILEWPDGPEALLEICQALEREAGRVWTGERNAPRPLDLDIIYVNGAVCSSERLTLPHPRWAERRFVVEPLADVRPALVLPGQTRTVREILATLPEGGVWSTAERL